MYLIRYFYSCISRNPSLVLHSPKIWLFHSIIKNLITKLFIGYRQICTDYFISDWKFINDLHFSTAILPCSTWVGDLLSGLKCSIQFINYNVKMNMVISFLQGKWGRGIRHMRIVTACAWWKRGKLFQLPNV